MINEIQDTEQLKAKAIAEEIVALVPSRPLR